MLAKLLALTLPLSIDSFLICAAIGTTRPKNHARARLSFVFAAFEGGMPLIGLVLGRLLSQGLGSAAEYAAGGILLSFGLYSLIFSKKEDKEASQIAGASGLTLLALGLGISIDSLAVGLSYGLLKISPLAATIAIVVQTVLATQLGFVLGRFMPARLRVWGESLASLTLAAIGTFIILQNVIA